MAERARHVGRVVDQVVGTRCVPAVVEKLDAEVSVKRKHPVAHLVDLVEERAVLRSECQAHDRPEVYSALTGGDGCRGARHCRREAPEQIGQLLGILDRLSDAVARETPPRNRLLVLVVLGRELLHEPVHECRRVTRVGLAHADFLSREHVEEQRQMRRMRVGTRAEVLGRTDGEAQFRVKVGLGRNGERVRFARGGAAVRREQRSDLLANARRVGIGNEEPDIIAEISER